MRVDEEGATRRVHDDLLGYLASREIPFQEIKPRNAQDLLEALAQIASLSQAGARPIIHLDTHGDKLHGLMVVASNEFVPWKTLIESLSVVNSATQNNLCVVSAACSSFNAILPIKIDRPCPFLLLIAPEREVSIGFVEDKTAPFYKSLFDGLDVINAYERHLKPNFRVFQSEYMLAVSLVRYIRDSCIGRGGDKRREDLLTQAMSSGIPNNRHNKRMVRKSAKSMTRPTQRLLDDYVHTFLMGRKVGFNIDDLESLARGAVRR